MLARTSLTPFAVPAIIKILVFLFAALPAHAANEQVLYSFCPSGECVDGAGPQDGLILDAHGNLYGTTYYGGANSYGTVFELTPRGNGIWTETVLHSFKNNGQDGIYPSAGLAFDGKGNLYGTTTRGGTHDAGSAGTVFELTPNGNGTWSETVLYSFCSLGCVDGQAPSGGLTIDAEGNLYGVTSEGGANIKSTFCPHGCGTVFELTPGAGGKWTESVLYSFCSTHECADGLNPTGRLALGAGGSLFGVTSQGGIVRTESVCQQGCGTVFELTSGSKGVETLTVLHQFNYTSGAVPVCSPVFDAAGKLYCTTSSGGAYGRGTAFQLIPDDNVWTQRVLHNFGKGVDGAEPLSGLILDAAGDLYGTTSGGGQTTSGVVFRLVQTDGEWVEKIIHTFGNGSDGTNPTAPLVSNTKGNLYGSTPGGGGSAGCEGGCGTVFEVMP